MDTLFAAWLAGFIDGEGSICVSTCGKFPLIYINLAQHSDYRYVLEEIQAKCGGRVDQLKRRPSIGKNPYNCSRWSLKRQHDVHAVLVAILPYLRVKRERAEKALVALDAQITRNQSNRWTETEITYMLANYGRGNVQAIATHLGRSYNSVQRKHMYLSHQ